MHTFKSYLTEKKITGYWHGSPTKISRVDVSKLPEWDGGVLQQGPGFYITTNADDATRYAGNTGYLHQLEINARKIVRIKGRINRTEIEKLINASPHRDDILTNWDENPVVAFNIAVDSIMKYSTGPNDAFQSVWSDFYRREEKKYLIQMVKLGYDAIEPYSPGSDNTKHMVVLNPKSVKIIQAIPVIDIDKHDSK